MLIWFSADSVPALWFSYHYLHKSAVPVVTQRVRLDVPETRFDIVAQLTNHVFSSGYLPSHLRSEVYWRTACGRVVGENESLQALLEAGEGICEISCLRLNIGTFVAFQYENHLVTVWQTKRPATALGSVHSHTVREERFSSLAVKACLELVLDVVRRIVELLVLAIVVSVILDRG